MAEGEDNVPKDIVEDLKKKEKLTYFLTPKESIAPVNKWRLHDAQCLRGDTESYYYALIKDTKAFKLKPEVYNYHKFLEENYS